MSAGIEEREWNMSRLRAILTYNESDFEDIFPNSQSLELRKEFGNDRPDQLADTTPLGAKVFDPMAQDNNITTLTRSHSAIAAKKRAKHAQIKQVVFDDEARRYVPLLPCDRTLLARHQILFDGVP